MSSVVVTQADVEAAAALYGHTACGTPRCSAPPVDDPWVQAFARHRIEATAELVEAAQRVLAWWDRTLATKLLSHNDFPWAEDAEWDEFFTLRNVLKATRPVS